LFIIIIITIFNISLDLSIILDLPFFFYLMERQSLEDNVYLQCILSK